jgi:hypothetical protein
VFSRELGFRILSAPGSAAAPSERCVFDAQLAGGEIFIESLSWRRLALVVEAPPGLAALRITGQARALRVFQGSSGTGIRTSWFRGWLTRVAADTATGGR